MNVDKPISEACFYINLDRSPERKERFLQNVTEVKDWPFPEPIRWPGVEAEPPDFFQRKEPYHARKGAWSCFLAHLRIYEHCILHGLNSVMIFEDDVDFGPDFGIKSRAFYDAACKRYPDWQQLYFGGNHHFKPYAFDDELVHCAGMCGGWAYMVRGVALSHIYEVFARRPDALCDDNLHMDVCWSTLHHSGIVQAIAPRYHLAGHRPGTSDRDKRMTWEHAEYFNRTDEELLSSNNEELIP